MVNMAIYVDNITENELDNEKKQFEIIKSLLEYIKSKRHIFPILHYKYIYASTGAFGMIYHRVIDDNEMNINELAKMITDFTSNICVQTKK